ncbi:MAG: arylsulfatase [Planctomycetota bacterium]
MQRFAPFKWLFVICIVVLLSSKIDAGEPKPSLSNRPNIVIVLCDDLGFGDVQCLAPETSKIPTPNADALAKQGVIFTDAHSGSSVCTPTRYGLLTGRYAWRTRLQKGVATGFAPSLIAPNRPTIASFLKTQGYDTACIGKWHLDFQYLDPKTNQPLKRKQFKLPPVGAIIPDGPVDRGFDYFHGFHHAREMKAVIENNQVIEHDDVKNMLPRLTQKAYDYLISRNNNATPFFLYLPLGSPHTPIVPTDEWKGKSGLGDYGDFVMQTDHALGKVCEALKTIGAEENTLLIFTSDNGCSKAAGIDKLLKQGHHVSGPLRGSKADAWEGGHRVPFIARWAKHIEPSTKNDRCICFTDMFATIADICQQPVPESSCEDSVSFVSELTNTRTETKQQRAGIVHHSVSGHFAYRLGDWKLILAKGSGGWTSPKENQLDDRVPKAQLYNLSNDLAEQTNLYDSNRTKADELLSQLKSDVVQGRSTKGTDSSNDIETIRLWKNRK